MDIDFNEEGQQFLKELEAGEYTIEILPNTAEDYQKLEARDLAAFKENLVSDDFKKLVEDTLS
jgi:hypothetical protein